MAVEVERDRDAAVTEPLLNYLRVNPRSKRQRRRRVAQIVKANARQAGRLDSTVKGVREEARVQRLACSRRKDMIVGLSPAEAQSITCALRSAREDGELARVSVVRSCD